MPDGPVEWQNGTYLRKSMTLPRCFLRAAQQQKRPDWGFRSLGGSGGIGYPIGDGETPSERKKAALELSLFQPDGTWKLPQGRPTTKKPRLGLSFAWRMWRDWISHRGR